MSPPRVLVESRHDLPIVHFQLILLTGSLFDPNGKEGLTRLAARLLRRGTHERDRQTIEERIDSLGAELSIETSSSTLRLSGSVIKRSLEPMIALVGELVDAPSLLEPELSLLKRETHAALTELTDSDSALVSTFFRRFLFRDHPYGRTSIGTHHTLEAIGVEDVRSVYRDHIKNAQRLVGFAGDITRDEASRLVSNYLTGKAGPHSERPRAPEPQVRPGRRLLIVDKPERTQTQIQIGCLGTYPHDPDHTALSVGNAIFGGTFTSRLMRAVRSERGWSYGASSRLGIDRVRESFSMWTFPAAEDAAPCIGLELTLFEQWVNQGVSEEELRFVQSYLANSYAFAIDTPDKRLEQAIELDLLDLPPDYFSGYVQRIQAVTRDEVNSALKQRFDPANLTLCVVGTAATLKDGLTALPGLTSVEVTPFDSL